MIISDLLNKHGYGKDICANTHNLRDKREAYDLRTEGCVYNFAILLSLECFVVGSLSEVKIYNLTQSNVGLISI